MEEIWKDVVGYEGLYKVSNLGRVKSIDRVVVNSLGVPRRFYGKTMVLQSAKNTGYAMVSLNKNGVSTCKYVHGIVGEAFIYNPHNKPYINHKDFNRTNNLVSNLEWVTNGENVKHSYTRDRHRGSGLIGEDVGNSKITNEQSLLIKQYLENGKRPKWISEKLSIPKYALYKITQGLNWKHLEIKNERNNYRCHLTNSQIKMINELGDYNSRFSRTRKPFPSSWVAKAFGVGSTTILKVWNGEYAGDYDR